MSRFNTMKKAVQIIRNKNDKSITLMASDNIKFSLIWLHGLGDSSEGFLDFFQIPKSPLFAGGRIKLLHAPVRPVSINGGAACPSWYDIKELKATGEDDKKYSMAEIKQSLAIIQSHVKGELEFWKNKGSKDQAESCRRIFIGGFSQGCAMSLLYGMTSLRFLGGVIAYSGHVFPSFQYKNQGDNA